MIYIIIFTTCLVISGCDNSSNNTRILAEKHINYKELSSGTYQITFNSPYFYGDRVRFNGVSGKESGIIVDICISEDGQTYYSVDLDNSDEIQGGVYSDMIKLISRPKKKKLQTKSLNK